MNVKFLLGIALASLLAVGMIDVAKEKSDKERITLLETAVELLSQDLNGAHEWAGNVNGNLDTLNSRTVDLNERLSRLENRGPVARVAVSGEKR